MFVKVQYWMLGLWPNSYCASCAEVSRLRESKELLCNDISKFVEYPSDTDNNKRKKY